VVAGAVQDASVKHRALEVVPCLRLLRGGQKLIVGGVSGSGHAMSVESTSDISDSHDREDVLIRWILRCRHMMLIMPQMRMREAAELLGVSDDTVRRWAESGRLASTHDDVGRQVVEGADLAALAQSLAEEPQPNRGSARNRLRGIVTRVVRDGVMAQVELQAGPFRLVSLMSREAADELGLEPGSLATAVVKSTNVIVEAAP
jgi:molybdopterin-binding protein